MKKDLVKSFLDIDGVSMFTFEDASLFEEYIVNENTIMYSNSWMYTLRSAVDEFGDLGYKYEKDGLLFTFSIKNGYLYVGKIFGLTLELISKVMSIIKELYDLSGLKIILKKIPSAYLNQFLSFERIRTHYSLDNMEVLIDECFPEKAVDLERIVKFDGVEYNIISKRFRQGVNRFVNLDIEIHVENPLESQHIDLEKQLSYLKSVSRNSANKFFAYKPMLQYLSLKENSQQEKYIVRVYSTNNQVEGYYILEELSDKTVGFYCGLTSIRYGGITEYLDALVFFELQSLGYEKVLLGGSEKIGVVEYVDKLLPVNTDYSVCPLLFS